MLWGEILITLALVSLSLHTTILLKSCAWNLQIIISHWSIICCFDRNVQWLEVKKFTSLDLFEKSGHPFMQNKLTINPMSLLCSRIGRGKGMHLILHPTVYLWIIFHSSVGFSSLCMKLALSAWSPATVQLSSVFYCKELNIVVLSHEVSY